MQTINEIIEDIKDKISHKIGDRAVLDKDVAKEINITGNRLSIHKKRETIPYVKVMDWCVLNNVSMKEIFYGDKKWNTGLNTLKDLM